MGTQELVVVAVIVLILFGGKKIPELARSVGQAVGEVQKGMNEAKQSIHEASQDPPRSAGEAKRE